MKRSQAYRKFEETPILIPALLEWWPSSHVMCRWTGLSVAVLGEGLEFVLGVAGSRRAGGSTRAAAMTIVGSLIGAIAGTALRVPIVETLIGACLGALSARCSGISGQDAPYC